MHPLQLGTLSNSHQHKVRKKSCRHLTFPGGGEFARVSLEEVSLCFLPGETTRFINIIIQHLVEIFDLQLIGHIQKTAAKKRSTTKEYIYSELLRLFSL